MQCLNENSSPVSISKLRPLISNYSDVIKRLLKKINKRGTVN